MSFFKKITSSIDARVTHFTQILKAQVNPLGLAPSGTEQHIFRGIGLSSIGESFSPERTLSLILKEWVKIRGMSVDSQISLLEWRVFSKNFWPGYPDFSSVNEWIAWRLQYEFPNHSFRDQDGWTYEFLEWAKSRAVDFFI